MDEPVKVRPYVLAALLCETAIIEQVSGRKTLVNIFDTVTALAYPVSHVFCVYVKMTDAEGMYRFRVDHASLSSDRFFSSIDVGELSVPDRLKAADLILTVRTDILEPGLHEFRVYANDEWLCSVSYTANLAVTTQE